MAPTAALPQRRATALRPPFDAPAGLSTLRPSGPRQGAGDRAL